jgi:hypothetical protein
VPVPALTVAKIELYDAMRRGKVSKSELARRLDVHLPQVDRLLDVFHASRLDQLERAAEALGTRIVLAFRPVTAPWAAVRAARRTASRRARHMAGERRRAAARRR